MPEIVIPMLMILHPNPYSQAVDESNISRKFVTIVTALLSKSRALTSL